VTWGAGAVEVAGAGVVGVADGVGVWLVHVGFGVGVQAGDDVHCVVHVGDGDGDGV
jgi:hypothetical protein